MAAENEIEIAAPPDRVWAVLADPENFDDWVVGAQNVRDADANWPAVGSKLHHSSGVGPLTIDDETQVEISNSPTQLVLLAKVGAAGKFRITLDLRATAAGTTLWMHEEAVAGLADHVPGTDSAVHVRNDISLERLKGLAEGTRAAGR
jgi:carbon monoxide dehydrogenase subunit G